jgi:hypothetical protein
MPVLEAELPRERRLVRQLPVPTPALVPAPAERSSWWSLRERVVGLEVAPS